LISETYVPLLGKIVLEIAASLITLGGLYDLLTPQLTPNLVSLCKSDAQAMKLVRELLRALGGALVAIGLTMAALAAGCGIRERRIALLLVLLLVLPAEGINSICMRRVGSPYLFPLGFTLLTLLGVILAWPPEIFYE
jgi:hypothetical protein